MTVYICDDNAYFADNLATALKEALPCLFDCMEIQTFTDGSAAEGGGDSTAGGCIP